MSKTTGVSEPDFAGVKLCRGGLALPAGEKDTELGRGGDSGAGGEDVLSMIAACFVRGRAISRDLVEAQSGLGMDCVPAREGLPATDGDVDEPRLDLKCTSMPPHPLGRHDRRARAREGVEHDVATPRAVLDGIGDESDRLGGGMRHRKIAARLGPDSIGRTADLRVIRGGTIVSVQATISARPAT